MSIFNTTVESLTPDAGKWKPTNGIHQAVVIALVDRGDEENTNDQGVTYMVRKMEIVFAIEEKNSNGCHMIVSRKVTMSMGENAILRKYIDDAGWSVNQISDILGQRAQIYTKITKSKAGKDYTKIETIDAGEGFASSGSIALPFWYNDVDQNDILKLQGIKIEPKRDQAPVAPPVVTEAPASDVVASKPANIDGYNGADGSPSIPKLPF